MTGQPILNEARRLHGLGLAVIWLHPKSKRPVESGWTTGPRTEWAKLEKTYKPGMNVGVRLGTPSKLKGGYLAVVDVDVKSDDPKHKREALAAAKKVLGENSGLAPLALSGRGGGSRHYYALTKTPFKTWNADRSTDVLKVHMPSKKPSKKELEQLTPKEIESGVRLSHAWEVALYSDGRQVVLAPSIHPDSGRKYEWKRPFSGEVPVVEFVGGAEESDVSGMDGEGVDTGVTGVAEGLESEAIKASKRSEEAALVFKVEPVDLGWLPIAKDMHAAIVHGTGVTDRSGFLMRASSALISAGLNQNEVLTVLTDPETYLGACGYEHAKTRNRTKAAEWVYRYTLKKVSSERSATDAFSGAGVVEIAKKLSPEEAAKQLAELKAGRSWKQDIQRGGQHGDGPPKGLVENVVLILMKAVSAVLIRRDLFALRDTYGVDAPWGGKKDEAVTDDDVIHIKFWLGQNWGFEPKSTVISEALIVIACKNSFDPVKDRLDALPAWDRVPRLDTWLAKHFHAKGDAEYLAQVFRKWVVAMVMRVYHPGSKFDWMPIFEGAQGVGKSSFGRLLVGDKHFLDWLPNLGDKDSALALQGMWSVEMGELANMRKTELEVVKGYITRTIDKVRPPFGRRWIESPRRCVFFGTTNRETYLTDDSGNRRFKPVMVGRLDFDALEEDREQLFAEAKWLWESFVETEKTLDLTGAAKLYESLIHREKTVEDESDLMLESTQDFLKKIEGGIVEFDLEKFRILDLFSGAGPLVRWKADSRNSQFASKMLRKIGAERRKIQGLYYWKISKKDEK